MRLTLFAVLLSLTMGARANEIGPLPEGWRFPTSKELAGEPLRKKSPTRYIRAIADFNGDGVPDKAFLVKSTRYSGEGLLLWLSDGPGKFKWTTLATIDWDKYPKVPLVMGIVSIKPGTYEYNCIEVGNDCVGSDDGKSKITLRRPALEYFKFESAASAFYWDTDKQTFIRIWISD
jgi:hypothetical protein